MGRNRLVENPINITIRMEDGLAKSVQKLARHRRVSAGVILREAVSRYMGLSKQQKDLKA